MSSVLAWLNVELGDQLTAETVSANERQAQILKECVNQ